MFMSMHHLIGSVRAVVHVHDPRERAGSGRVQGMRRGGSGRSMFHDQAHVPKHGGGARGSMMVHVHDHAPLQQRVCACELCHARNSSSNCLFDVCGSNFRVRDFGIQGCSFSSLSRV